MKVTEAQGAVASPEDAHETIEIPEVLAGHDILIDSYRGIATKARAIDEFGPAALDDPRLFPPSNYDSWAFKTSREIAHEVVGTILADLPEETAVLMLGEVHLQEYSAGILSMSLDSLRSRGYESIGLEFQRTLQPRLEEIAAALGDGRRPEAIRLIRTLPFGYKSEGRMQSLMGLFEEAHRVGMTVHAIDDYDPTDGVTRDQRMAEAISTLDRKVVCLLGANHVQPSKISPELQVVTDTDDTDARTILEQRGARVWSVDIGEAVAVATRGSQRKGQ